MTEQERLEKRINQLEKELIFTQESLRNSIKMCARQFENMQRYVKALEDIKDLATRSSIDDFAYAQLARQALKGNTDG